VFGKNTQKAVNNYKKEHGLGNTGVWAGVVGDQPETFSICLVIYKKNTNAKRASGGCSFYIFNTIISPSPLSKIGRRLMNNPI
jgi:peptidoglycan hydrolase-like protein with peptidoglycan-binding domain